MADMQYRAFSIVAVLFTMLASSADAAEFSCDEAGLDAAIAAAEDLVSPDPGPHSFDCTGPTVIPVTTTKFVGVDITLDGGGLVTFDRGDLFPSSTFWIMQGAATRQEFRNLDVIGGGIEVFGELTLLRVRITGYSGTSGGNSGRQPAIFLRDGQIIGSGGTLRLIESSIEHNDTCALQSGGGGSAVIESSTISRNSGLACGGVHVFSVEITNSTISENTNQLGVGCAQSGGVDAGVMVISQSTISGNESPAGGSINVSYGFPAITVQPGQPPSCVIVAGTPVVLTNTIVEGACINPAAAIGPSGGGNIESPGDTCLFDDPADQVNVTAGQVNLDVLADNDGPTETHALLPGSAAIDSAVLANCPLYDQRGAPRPDMGGTDCDSGAYEVPEPSFHAMAPTGIGLLWAFGHHRRFNRARTYAEV